MYTKDTRIIAIPTKALKGGTVNTLHARERGGEGDSHDYLFGFCAIRCKRETNTEKTDNTLIRS